MSNNYKYQIAIDTGPLTSGHAVRGIGFHTKELIAELKKIKSKNLDIDGVDFQKADLSKYDLVHYQYFYPFFLSLPIMKKTKTLITIHDLIYLIYPKAYLPGLKGKLRFLLQRFLIKSVDGIITISETSKKDIVRFLGIKSDRIRVIRLAPRKIFKRINNTTSLRSSVVKKYKNLPKNFVLYVGDVNYNKNIPGLIRACKQAKTTLVIVGKQALDIENEGMERLPDIKGPKDWVRFLFNIPHPELAHYQNILKEFKENKNIIRLGFVSDEDLVAVYNLASVYCQPSFYEGFGLPLLEAMACGTPVVASKIQAHVEIAKDSVLYFDRKSSKDLAKKIKGLMEDEKQKEILIKKGIGIAGKYSWMKVAKETLDVYEKVLERV